MKNINMFAIVVFLAGMLLAMLAGSAVLLVVDFSPLLLQLLIGVNVLVTLAFIGAVYINLWETGKRENALHARIAELEEQVKKRSWRVQIEKDQANYYLDCLGQEYQKRLQFMKVQALKEGRKVFFVSGWAEGREIRDFHMANTQEEVRALYPPHYGDFWKADDDDYPFIVIYEKM